MRGRWIGSLLALFAACDDSVWIDIRVPAGLAADEVELFLAVAPCERSGEACRGVRPSQLDEATPATFIPATVFEHDTNITFVAPVSDGSASFRLPASSETLPALLAIGVTGPERTAVGGVVLAELDLSLGARHVIATLEPADQRTQVYRWPDPEDPARAQIACAGLRHTSEPGTFLVSPSDWDCDGFPNDGDLECNPLVYRASAPKEACATAGPTGGPEDACMLGSGSCQDGLGTTCTLDEPTVCVPQQLCDKCDFPDRGCLEEAFATGPTHVACTFPVVKEGGDHYTVCGPDNNTASALADLFVTSNLACLVPPLLTDELFAQDAPAPLLTFSSDGQLAALEIVPITSSPCQVSVRLGGDLGPSFQMQRFPLHLDAGGGPPRTIVVPLEIAIQEIDQLACDAGAVPEPCTIVSDQETALACVRP